MSDVWNYIDAMPDTQYVAWFVVALFLFALGNETVKLMEAE